MKATITINTDTIAKSITNGIRKAKAYRPTATVTIDTKVITKKTKGLFTRKAKQPTFTTEELAALKAMLNK